MNKVIVTAVFLFMLIGCTKVENQAQKNAPVTPAQEVKQVEVVQPAAPAEVVQKVEDVKGEVQEKVDVAAEVTTDVQQADTQALSQADVVKEIEEQVNEVAQQVQEEAQQVVGQVKELAKPDKKGEEIIASNSWGYSVFDPQTGIVEFYTTTGILLGSKKR